MASDEQAKVGVREASAAEQQQGQSEVPAPDGNVPTQAAVPDGHAPANVAVPDAHADGHASTLALMDPATEPAADMAVEVAVDASVDGHRSPALAYPLVAFGASAGGIQAFSSVLDNLPGQTGMSYVLVTHLAPDQKSYLGEIMERHTAMPVLAIEDGQKPLPDHVYILLPNYTVQMHEGVFRLSERVKGTRSFNTIDVFFRSLAADQKNHAIGVVLSGADSDGALGLKAIKGEGGVAIVQTPETAMHSGMPRSSIAADHVDLVLAPNEIALELARLAHQFTRPELRLLDNGRVPEGEEQAYQRILQLLRAHSGLEVRQYKPETVRRRIARRMLLLRKETLAEYFRFLQVRNDEIRALQEDILINVTRFFRDPEFWDSLTQNVLPKLFENRRPEQPVRVWCAGCSTGEEAYSLAITLLEYVSSKGLDTQIQVFGTDASERAIETARMSMYPETIANEIAPERLRRFFVSTERGYQVTKRVRDTCIFARQNLCSDPPFSHIDILSCRNVLIYFNLTLQRQVISTFHYALEPNGFMLLGLSEGLREYGDIFSIVDRRFKIYMKTGNSAPNLEIVRMYQMPAAPASPVSTATSMDGGTWPELELQRAVDRIILARYGPAGLVVDDKMNVLQSRGHISPYLDLMPGTVSWNLSRVLRDDIFSQVRQTVQHAVHENIPSSTSFGVIDAEKGDQEIQVDVLPITNPASRQRCFLVLFRTTRTAEPLRLPEVSSTPLLPGEDRDRINSQLRQDLTATRLHLQSLIEERDARNQELVSANEEIQSANEELQSTNEELETTKEELQSANEELQTVNEELQQRNSTLAQTGNDLTNLLNSVNIPLLMLTEDLKIRQFTPPMQRLLNVRASDIGRAISEIRLQLSLEDISPILHDVLYSLGTRELEVQDRDGKWYLMRVRPYRTSENKIEGLVVVLLDIDQLRSSQQQMLEARDFARSVLESVPAPVVVLNKDCTLRTVNTQFRELTQMSARELIGRSLPDLMQHLWGINISTKLDRLAESDAPASFETEHESTTGDRKILLVKAQTVFADGDKVFLLMIEDITIRRHAEQLLAQQKRALEGEVEIAARKLDRTQEELRSLTAHLFSVQEEERQRVARELHDDIAQRLSVLELLLADAQTSASGNGRIAEARKQVERLSSDVRGISHQLHPAILDDLGLSSALKALVDEFGAREGMPASYVGRDLPEIPPQPAATAVYRITQEALRNVAKHAGKTHVKVFLEAKDDCLHLEVRDLGMGFDQDFDGDGLRRGLGLITMKERARLAHGSLSITSALGEGTTVTAEIPFSHDA